MSLTALNGDCLEIMKTLPDASVDLFITDLPFGCLTGGGGKEKAKRAENGKDSAIGGCDWDIKIDLTKFWAQVKRLAKNDNTPVIMFCNTRFGYELIKSNESWFRTDLVWHKTNAVGFLAANKQPLRAHENIYVFAKKGAFYKRINIKGDFPKGGGGRSKAGYLPIGEVKNTGQTIAGERCPTSVIKVANKKTKDGHPTAKPHDLYEWLIERYSNEGDTVLDPTAGSFNSVETAYNLKRNAIGIEMDVGYFNAAYDRLELEPAD
jgi:site-specific DNA-methyltransferase (adenine-specific)